MPKNIRESSYIRSIYISQKNYDRLLMWSLSEKEINFICFGKGNQILEVVRLANTASSPKRFACWHEKVSRDIVRTRKLEGKKVIAWGHSHPDKGNDQHPSKTDIEAISKGKVEIIVFPPTQSIRAWKIQKTLTGTLNSEILITINILKYKFLKSVQ